VLREGNSDRRAPLSVQGVCQEAPAHKWGPGQSDSKTHVVHMKSGDFRSNEKSVTVAEATEARIELSARTAKPQYQTQNCSSGRRSSSDLPS